MLSFKYLGKMIGYQCSTLHAGGGGAVYKAAVNPQVYLGELPPTNSREHLEIRVHCQHQHHKSNFGGIEGHAVRVSGTS